MNLQSVDGRAGNVFCVDEHDPEGVVREAIATVLARLPKGESVSFADGTFVRFYVTPSSGVALGFGLGWGECAPKYVVVLNTGAVADDFEALAFDVPDDDTMRRFRVLYWTGVVAHETGHVAQKERNPLDDGSESSADWWAFERGFGNEVETVRRFHLGELLPEEVAAI